MVRVNIIHPKHLADQHLIAEYNEILMLFGYVKKYSKLDKEKIPKNYVLGKGHMLFFKDKLRYLKDRHEKIKVEMNKRGFVTRLDIKLKDYNKKLYGNWKACKKDKEIIKKRIIEKINKKPEYYRYYRVKKPKEFLIELIKNAN